MNFCESTSEFEAIYKNRTPLLAESSEAEATNTYTLLHAPCCVNRSQSEYSVKVLLWDDHRGVYDLGAVETHDCEWG